IYGLLVPIKERRDVVGRVSQLLGQFARHWSVAAEACCVLAQRERSCRFAGSKALVERAQTIGNHGGWWRR
ncbi:hypothetical protein ABTE65_19390, partial [Acinetobacter baumannii]